MKRLILIALMFPLILFGQTKIRNTQITSGSQPEGKIMVSDGATNVIWGTKLDSITGTSPIVVSKTSSDVFNVSINPATTTTPGSMSAADKLKLDSLQNIYGYVQLDQLSDSIAYLRSQIPDVSFYKLISDSTLASGYATVHRLNGKEPEFTKNTGFNKNFGSTSGTVLEGRTFGTAANNDTVDFEVPLTFSTGLSRVGNTVTATIPTFDWKADTTWVLNKNYLQSETPQNLSLSGNTISLSGSSATVNIAASTAVAANSAKVSNATHTGDATGSTALTVVGINNTNLAGLATGILKNTTGSGTPSIATSSDFKTINGTSVLGGGSITVGGDVTKVGTPVNNQIGVWTGNGTIEGDSKLTWDGQFLGLTGATSSSPLIKWKDEDYPTVSLLQEFNAGQMTFGVGTAGNEYATLWVDQSGIRTSGLHLNAYSYPAYDDEGSIRYRNIGGGVYDFQGNVNGTWMSLTTGGSGSGMTDPMTTRGDIITRNASNTTARLGLGTSGQYLQSNGTDLIWGSAPAGSSQWTTQSNGITYGSNVGIGASADASVRFNLLSTVATAPAAYMKNSSTTGHGLWVYGGSTSDQAALFVADYNGANSFLNIRGNGDILLGTLKEDAAPANIVYYNTTTKALSYGVKPSGGTGGSGTVTSFSAGDISGLLTTTETNPTTTPALSFTLNNQAQNLVYSSPYASSGTPTFRSLNTNDLPSTSVTPGSYTASNITVDAKGRITAASSGSSGSGMVYPSGSGIPIVSGGTSWGPTIANNSANWNTAVTNMGKIKFSGESTYNNLNSADFLTSGGVSYLNKINTPTAGSLSVLTAGGAYTHLQPILVSGTNIKTINGTTLLGSGDITISGGGITDGDKGDITVSSSGTVWNIDAGVVGATELASTSVTANNYTLGSFTVDADGRLTAASSGSIKYVNGRNLIGSGDISEPSLKTSNTSFSLNVSLESNARISTNTNITITISNLGTIKGQTGNIEVTYTGASVITFDVPDITNVYIASNIYNTTVDANTKTVLSKSSGTAVYSYYVSGNNIYIHGTQNYN